MDIILKAIVTGIAAFFLLAGGYAAILGAEDVVSTQNYLESVSATIADSNYNETVIQTCIEEAASYGYELNVTVYGADLPGMQRYADIKLTYTFEIPLINYSKEKVRQKVM